MRRLVRSWGPWAAQPEQDQAGNGQLAEIEPVAEPWLEQLLRFGFGKRVDGFDRRRLAGEGDGLGDEAFNIVAGARFHLDRGVAHHVRAPGLRGVGDQQRRARGEAGEKGHDRDDDDERAARDRVARDERRPGLERGLRGDGADGLDDGFVHDDRIPSKIVSLPSPTTSRRAKPN